MSIRLEKTTIYNEEVRLFDNFSLLVKKGEVVTIMGPSGCGKSTLLSFICGALGKNDFHYKGNIYLNGKEISHLPIQKRKIGILFQDDLLFPHMNVEENLLFALPFHLNKREKQEKITFFLSSAKLLEFKTKPIYTLSGGQKARISLIRALLAEPKVLLLDEPFSKLDAKLRLEMRNFVFNLIKKLNIPTILVTHDEKDAPPQSKIIHLT